MPALRTLDVAPDVVHPLLRVHHARRSSLKNSPRWFRRIKNAIRSWWECRTRRCSYYEHYLVYGPAELTHIGWHKAEQKGAEHFKSCRRDDGLCGVCLAWERRLRA